MAKKTISVEVESNTYDAGQGVAKFVKALKAAAADGYQGGDLPVVVKAAIDDLMPLLGSLKTLPGEALEDHAATARAVSLGVCDALFS